MSERYQTVLLFGPPGAGKGTQGRVIGAIPGFYHCACGDVFRRMSPHSRLGRIVVDYVSRGELVPDDKTVEIWSEALRAAAQTRAFKPETDLLILDGIPRNLHQAELIEDHIDVLKVMQLVCADEEKMIERLRRRALKENRIDDAREPVIRHRWDVYQRDTAPVLDYYPDEKIATIEAMHSPAEVLRQILDVIIPIQNEHFARLEQMPIPAEPSSEQAETGGR